MNVEVLATKEGYSLQKEVIAKIRDVINLKNLEPGEKLPSERMLSEKFGVTRSVIREAIQKLEFYGLLQSIPQSGTFVANIGIIALNGIIDDILRLEDADFKSLVETRILLELKTVRLAALRRTEEDLISLRTTLDKYNQKVRDGKNAFQEDLLFHLAIAKASKNGSMNTLMLMITPEIITNFQKYHVCDSDMEQASILEHERIYEAIKNQDTKKAKKMMKQHFKALYQYCYESD